LGKAAKTTGTPLPATGYDDMISCPSGDFPRRRTLLRPLVLVATLLLTFVGPTPLWAAEDGRELLEMSLETLMNLEVTSAAKSAQPLAEAAAAIFVISREEIRRSGVTSIPEALRLAPGVQVARISANAWAVSARGFNGRFANKLLVLMDGRSLYNSMFSGVFWDVQDTLLEDVERIEVIRGPGAVLWGANAVNGVINIITRSAEKTTGTLLTAGGGTEERAFVAARQGMRLGDHAALRIWGKGFERDGGHQTDDGDGADDWRSLRGGLRLDGEDHRGNSYLLTGDLYRAEVGETFSIPQLTPPYSTSVDMDTRATGGFLLGRWKHLSTRGSEFALQLYYDRARNQDLVARQLREVYDLDLQHRLSPGNRHTLLWGGGYRYSPDRSGAGAVTSFSPADSNQQLFRFFLQDDIVLVEKRLRLILGAQVEHNDHSGWEIQPTLRLLGHPRRGQTLWAAVSRAVRTPARSEDDIRINQTVLPDPATPTLVILQGSRSVQAEDLLALEAGYRGELGKHSSFDVAAFYHRYSNLVTVEPGTPYLETTPAPTHGVFPLVAANTMDGDSFGVELAADWQVLPSWRLQGSYSYLQLLLDVDEGSNTRFKELAETSPHHQGALRSSLNLTDNLEWDLWWRYVGDLPTSAIRHYQTLDARIAWRPRTGLELAVVGQNLLAPHHGEFASEHLDAARIEIERGVYGKATWQF